MIVPLAWMEAFDRPETYGAWTRQIANEVIMPDWWTPGARVGWRVAGDAGADRYVSAEAVYLNHPDARGSEQVTVDLATGEEVVLAVVAGAPS